jgi:hypothetical protein
MPEFNLQIKLVHNTIATIDKFLSLTKGNNMINKFLTSTLFVFLFVSINAFAEEEMGSVTISSPLNGAMFGPKEKIVLDYVARTGSESDHLHLMVDGKRVKMLQKLKGTAEAGPLSSGMHKICLVLAVTITAHSPTSSDKCIDVVIK